MQINYEAVGDVFKGILIGSIVYVILLGIPIIIYLIIK